MVTVGGSGLLLAGLAIGLTYFTTSHFAVIACLSLAYGGITFQQPAVFAACADVGGLRSGAVTCPGRRLGSPRRGDETAATRFIVFRRTENRVVWVGSLGIDGLGAWVAGGEVAAPLDVLGDMKVLSRLWWKVDVTKTVSPVCGR